MAMTNEKVIEAFHDAASTIHGRMGNLGPSRLSEPRLALPWTHLAISEVLCHLLFLCQEGERMLVEEPERREKVMRWLGFVQGTLWAIGFKTIAEAKNANRPDPPDPPNEIQGDGVRAVDVEAKAKALGITVSIEIESVQNLGGRCAPGPCQFLPFSTGGPVLQGGCVECGWPPLCVQCKTRDARDNHVPRPELCTECYSAAVDAADRQNNPHLYRTVYAPHVPSFFSACDGCGKARGECTCGESFPTTLPSGYDEETFDK